MPLEDGLRERVQALLVRAADEELLPHFARAAREIKPDGSLVTVADTAMQARLARELAACVPGAGMLGEEMDEAAQRAALAHERLWCLDPLDGTSNFANGVPMFAVSLALLDRGAPVRAWIYDPIRKECFTAERGRGAWCNGAPLRVPPAPPPLRRSLAVVDFKRLNSKLAARLALDPPYSSQRNFGCCALEWCWLADGRFHLYLHGGQKSWDYAAGALVLHEAGGYAQTLDGEAVFAPSLPARSIIAARDPELFKAWKAWFRHNA